MNESIAYIGLDVHKDTIAVAVAYAGHEEPVYHGIIAHTDKGGEQAARAAKCQG